MPKEVKISKSGFAESFLYLKGKPFSLEHYPFLYQIYDTDADSVCMKFSRQTSKSSTLANLLIINSATIPYFHSMYVAPHVPQTQNFSNDRVKPVLEGSPIIKEYYINSTLMQNVFTKELLNGSVMFLRYALLNADHLRGFSCDLNVFDEVQDLRADIIPVVLETMSHSDYKWTFYAGTPKRTQGTLATIWEKSTQSEFIIKCEACNNWNILGEANIGSTGPICAKCGSLLTPRNGEWVSAYDPNEPKPAIEGYRICLLHFAGAPWVNWQKDVIYKYENMEKSIFFNEVLALEYDEGAAPITKPEIQAVCDEDKIMSTSLNALEMSYPCIMGVDYGPINSEASHTVISVVQKRAEKYYLLYAKKFQGKEADYSFIHKEIPRLMKHFNVQHLAADYGMGEASNSEIRSRVGYQSVIAFQHLTTQKEKIRWNAKMPAYTLNRNQVITDFFQMIKKGELFFPRWEDTKSFAKDLLNVQMEYDTDHNSMKYINIGPDDFLHATLFAVLSLQLFYGIPQSI